jgi:hypothetical protein
VSDVAFNEAHDGLSVEQAEAWAVSFELDADAMERHAKLLTEARKLPVRAAREFRVAQLDAFLDESVAMAKFARSLGGYSRSQVNGLLAGSVQVELKLRIIKNDPIGARRVSDQMYALRMHLKSLIAGAGETEAEASAL